MTVHEAYILARKYNLTDQVKQLIDTGYSPEEALEEWGIL